MKLVVDKNINDNENNRNNKANVGLAIDTTVVVFIILIRKKFTNNKFHDLKTNDIADDPSKFS